MSECTRQNNHCGNLRCQLYCNYCLRNIVYISLSAQQRKQAIYCRFYRSKFRKQILVQGINGVLLIFIFDLLGKKKFHDMVQVMIIIYHINPTLLNFNEQLTYNFFFHIGKVSSIIWCTRIWFSNYLVKNTYLFDFPGPMVVRVSSHLKNRKSSSLTWTVLCSSHLS